MILRIKAKLSHLIRNFRIHYTKIPDDIRYPVLVISALFSSVFFLIALGFGWRMLPIFLPAVIAFGFASFPRGISGFLSHEIYKKNKAEFREKRIAPTSVYRALRRNKIFTYNFSKTILDDPLVEEATYWSEMTKGFAGLFFGLTIFAVCIWGLFLVSTR